MKQLTRRQAWLKIKQAFKAFKGGKLTMHGLCYAVRRLHRLGVISIDTLIVMDRDIVRMRPTDKDWFAYYWPTRSHGSRTEAKKGAAARVKAITKFLKKKS